MELKIDKIFFIHIFFNYNISDVVNELNRSYKLRKFAGILEVPSETQVFMSILVDMTLKPTVIL